MKNSYLNYTIGTKIKINHIEDKYANLDGKIGTIEYIDDMGQLHGSWGSVALIPEIDDIQIYEDWKCQMKKHLNESQEYGNKWKCSDFYDNHCKLYDGTNEFYIEYDINFIDNDFNFDNIKITKIRYWNNHNMVPRLSTLPFNELLWNTYYEEIQDGFAHAVYDDQVADYWIDVEKSEFYD